MLSLWTRARGGEWGTIRRWAQRGQENSAREEAAGAGEEEQSDPAKLERTATMGRRRAAAPIEVENARLSRVYTFVKSNAGDGQLSAKGAAV